MIEVGLTIWDIYETGTTLLDPCASLGDKTLSGGGLMMGAVLPGGGYGAGGKAGKKALGARQKGRDPDLFLPDSYYDQKLNARAPGQSAPYGRHERFDADGNLKQVTDYDQFGDRLRQYDVGSEARHSEGFHTFDYGAANPRQAPGGGRRSIHIPLDEFR